MKTKFDADFERAAMVGRGTKKVEAGPEFEGVTFHDIDQHADQTILDELSGIGDVLEQMAWRCGWLTDKLYLNLIANKLPVDYMYVCYYVSVTKLRGHRSANTVKKWALTARFFPEKVARKLHFDMLPFSHFAYAAKWGDLTNPKTGRKYWRDVLEYSWDFYLNSPVARYASVADLEAEFEGKPKKERVPGAAGQQVGKSEFVPPVESADDDPVVYESVVPGAVMRARSEDLSDQEIFPILEGAIQNFTLAVSNYIPVLNKRHPFLAQGLSGIIALLRELSSKMIDGG